MKQKLIVIKDILKSDFITPNRDTPEIIEKGTITWIFGRLNKSGDCLLENNKYRSAVPSSFFEEVRK